MSAMSSSHAAKRAQHDYDATHEPAWLPELPFTYDALEPFISETTMRLHYGKHHRSYVEHLSELTANTELAGVPLETVVRRAASGEYAQAVFNNAAQAWNHEFFWNCMTPEGGGPALGAIAKSIDSDLGGYDAFAKKFAEAATNTFGSGWAWLVLDRGRLRVTSTSNADTPLVDGEQPLLVIDIWEHAYYLDYQNRRKEYVQNFIQHLINWDAVNDRLQSKSAP